MHRKRRREGRILVDIIVVFTQVGNILIFYIFEISKFVRR